MTLLDQAKVSIDRKQFPQAVGKLTEHLNSDFHDDMALFMLGACHLQLGNHGLAAAVTRQAIECRQRKAGKQFPEALGNLAACFKAENKPEAAADLWKMALEIETDEVERARFYMNIGGCHINYGAPEKALEWYDKSIALRPDLQTCQFNRSFALLELGRWAEGWEAFEWGLVSGDRKNRLYRGGDVPVWNGEPNKTVIVWGEQGVGDEILFASVMPDMINRCKHVIFDCHPRLVNLFERSFPGATIHGTRKTLSELKWLDDVEPDASVCISSLPYYFRNKDKDFPGKPFLKADPGVMPHTGRPKIGISWQGGTKKTHTDLRTVPLDLWAPLIKSVDADWFSLQYTDNAAQQVCAFEEQHDIKIHHYPGQVQCDDYDTTASFVAGLDLVITVCTATHHLGNALGVPTWTLVPSKPAWRYAKKGELWYKDTARFFRQAPGEPWSEVMERVTSGARVKFEKMMGAAE